MSGLRSLWAWMKANKWTAVLVFLVVVPVVLGGLFVWVRRKESNLPVIGPFLAKLGITDNLAA